MERANSSLKLVKTDRRNKVGESRLNGLLLLFLHKYIQLQVDKVVDTFVRRNPRRLLLANPI